MTAELYTSDGDIRELGVTTASIKSRAVYIGQPTSKTQRGELVSKIELYAWNGYQREFGGTLTSFETRLYTWDGYQRELGGTSASCESRAVYVGQPTARTQRSELASTAELYTSDADQHELGGTTASINSRAVYIG